MNKYIPIGFVVSLAAVLALPAVAGAQYYTGSTYNPYQYSYTNNNSAQISQIQAQINALNQQIASLQSSSYNNTYQYSTYNPNYSSTYNPYTTSVMGAYASCNFTQYLALGSSGQQVMDLNRVLGAGTSSYFDQTTYNAVVRFQTQYASEILSPAGLTYATGVVGAFTRAKLNQVCNGQGSVLGASTYNPYYTSTSGTYNPYQYPYNYNTSYNPSTTYTGALNVNFSASATSVGSNQNVTLTWSSNTSSNCNASGAWSGGKNNSGSQMVYTTTGTNTYVLTCYGPSGESQTRSVVVTSNYGSTGTQYPSITFYASPSSVQSGGSTTLTWNVQNASNCNSSGDWGGTQGASGSQYFSGLNSTKSYVLSCTSSSGQTTSQTVSVGVYAY